MSLKANEVKQTNVFLTTDGRLDMSPKTLAVLLGSQVEIIWIKYKNSLETNNDAVIQLHVNTKKANVVRKYQDAVSNNRTLKKAIQHLREIGFSF